MMPLRYENWGIEVTNSRMHLAGCDLVTVAEEYGTPLFVVNEEKLRVNCRAIRHAFTPLGEKPATFFSYKTNSIPGILEIIHEEGFGAEVISEFELELARSLGVPDDRIVFDAICKTDAVLEKLVRRPVKIINIDSDAEIEPLGRLAKKYERRIEVGVRVHTGAGWGRNPFGVPVDEIIAVFDHLLTVPNLRPTGLLVHSSPWAVSPRDYLDKARQMIDLCCLLKDKLQVVIKHIDLGGGYGCPTIRKLGRFEHLYNATFGLDLKPPRPELFVPLPETITQLIEEVQAYATQKGVHPPTVCLEPGMAVVANTQFLLARVNSVKKINGEHIVITDAGKMNLAQPLRTEYHELLVVNRPHEPCQRHYRIIGRMCSPSDWLYRKKRLPDVKPGDILAVMDTGAYFNALSNNFSFPRPPVVSICNGETRLMRRGEDFAHMTALDGGLE